MKNLNIQVSTLLIASTFMLACNTPQVVDFANTADANVELARVEREITAAKINQVDVLAPYNYYQANSELEAAREARADEDEQRVVLHKIALAEAYLNRAISAAKVSEQILPEVVRERGNALVAEAPRHYGVDFNIADQALKRATSKIELNDLAISQDNREVLARRYVVLSTDTMKLVKLSQAREVLIQARKEGAQKLVPQMLAWAEKKVQDSDIAIERYRNDSVEIDRSTNEANSAAQRVLSLVREAKYTSELTPEQRALQHEKDRNAVAVAERASMVQSRELTQSNETLATMISKNEQLESDAMMEQEYESAKEQFTDSEADVYKQGNTVVIRLKGLAFAENQTEISNNNRELLAKVQKVLKESEANEVVIEGHTDSIGTKIANDKLSEARAEAVSKYLITDNAAIEEKLSTRGYGDAKPISSNKTSEGRAQNRRIDIIMTSTQE